MEFWEAYPKKVAKAAALKAWKKLKPDQELTNTILAAIEKQKQSDQWRKDNGQYIPNPATWLNGGRWEEPLLIGDIIPDESAAAVFEMIERLDEYRPLYNAIDSLTEIGRFVILEYYFKGLTYKQIGERHGLSAERVRQLHNEAIRTLQHGEQSAKLRSIYGADKVNGARARQLPR